MFRSERPARVSATAFRGASHGSGDRRRKRLHAGTRKLHSGKKRKANKFFCKARVIRISKRHAVQSKLLERFERFTQHGDRLLSVVAKPSFPKGKGPDAIVWYSGFAIGMDVFDVLTRTSEWMFA